jgi:serine/threonine-protein kinase
MLSGSRPFDAPSTKADGTGRSSRPPPHPERGDRSAAQRIRRDAPAPLRDRAPHVPRTVERLVMRLLEKSPSERYGSASIVLERLQRELRVRTREDAASVVRSALVQTGLSPSARRPDAAAAAPRRVPPMARVVAGQALVLVAFAAGAFAIEGGSWARPGSEPGSKPLELQPAQGGGLRVLATPWANVSVDGERVETTPFARPIPLPPGKHWILLTHPEAPPLEREITVAPGETVTLEVTMLLRDAGS